MPFYIRALKSNWILFDASMGFPKSWTLSNERVLYHNLMILKDSYMIHLYNFWLWTFCFRALSQASGIASSSRDPSVCDQMKGSLIKKQVRFRILILAYETDSQSFHSKHSSRDYLNRHNSIAHKKSSQ